MKKRYIRALILVFFSSILVAAVLLFPLPTVGGSVESGYVLQYGFFEQDGEGEAIDADDTHQKLNVDLGKAIRFRDLPRVELLMDAGADLNFSPIPQEQHPCFPGQPHLSCSMCCVFQDPGPLSGVDDFVENPKSVELLLLLLRKGLNLNARCATNGSMLERALLGYLKQKKEMLAALMDYGLAIDSEVVRRCLDHTPEQHKRCPGTCLRTVESCKELERLIDDKIREREEAPLCLGEVHICLPVPELVNMVGEYAYPCHEFQEYK